ncbi:MAG: ABC transporter ATP-binding protein [Candidatus Cloacimonetes bacterium]|nr:ABC transporter ATP-binding protein [Candidatus Cloacimonadota bacterium]
MIEAIDLKKYYTRGIETVKALDGVNFEISAGEIVAIVGPSGSGKTTLMNLISCLDNATQGVLKINGTDVTHLKEAQLIKIRRENIGFIFQQFYLIPTLTVKENIELPSIFANKKFPAEIINNTLKQLGLAGKENLPVKMLNSGDKQRVSIARALIDSPRLIIADEPTGKLENKVRDEILVIFKELAKRGIAIFIATHDLELAANADRIIHLQDGKIVSKAESDLYE